MIRKVLLSLAMLIANYSLVNALSTRQRNKKMAEIEAFDFSPYLDSTGRLDPSTVNGDLMV